MKPANIRDMIEMATEKEKRQFHQWANYYLRSKLTKRTARARREIEAGIESEEDYELSSS